jgi:hypothetical protein
MEKRQHNFSHLVLVLLLLGAVLDVVDVVLNLLIVVNYFSLNWFPRFV